MDLLNLSIVMEEVILLLIKLLGNLLLVLIQRLIIIRKVLVNVRKLLFHSFLDISSPFLQFFDLILQDRYVIFALFGPLPQERLVQAKVIEIVELLETH